MKRTYIMEGGKLVERYPEGVGARVHLQGDAMDAFPSPVTGEVIGSRSQWDKHLKANGHHISEAGDIAEHPKVDAKADVRLALKQLGVK